MEAPAASTPHSSAPPRFALPREHGAYAELAYPLLTALIGGRASPAALLLTIAAVLTFIAHEPLKTVMLGRRRQRERPDGARAHIHLWVLGVSALTAGGLGLWLGPEEARAAAILPIVLAMSIPFLLYRGAERTLGGHLLATVGLVSAALPVGIAAGIPIERALCLVGVWIAVFVLGTFAVQVTLARQKAHSPQARSRVRLGGLLVAAACFLLIPLVAWGAPAPFDTPLWLFVAAVPSAIAPAIVAMFTVSARKLRRLGWALVLGYGLTFLLLVVGLRLIATLEGGASMAAPLI